MKLYSVETLQNRQSKEAVGTGLIAAGALSLYMFIITKIAKKGVPLLGRLNESLERCIKIANKQENKDFECSSTVPQFKTVSKTISVLGELTDQYGKTLVSKEFDGKKFAQIMKKNGFTKIDETFWTKLAGVSGSTITALMETAGTGVAIGLAISAPWMALVAIPAAFYTSKEIAFKSFGYAGTWLGKVKQMIKGAIAGKKLNEIGWTAQNYKQSCTKLRNIIENLYRNLLKAEKMDDDSTGNKGSDYKVTSTSGSADSSFSGFSKFLFEMLEKTTQVMVRIGDRVD